MDYKENSVCLDRYSDSTSLEYFDKSVILTKSLEQLFSIRFTNNQIVDNGMLHYTKLKNFQTIHLWMRLLGFDRFSISEVYQKSYYVITNFLEETKELLRVIPLNEIRYKRNAILILFELRNRIENEIFCFDHLVLFQELLLEIMTLNSTKISSLQQNMWNQIIQNRYTVTKWI